MFWTPWDSHVLTVTRSGTPETHMCRQLRILEFLEFSFVDSYMFWNSWSSHLKTVTQSGTLKLTFAACDSERLLAGTSSPKLLLRDSGRLTTKAERGRTGPNGPERARTGVGHSAAQAPPRRNCFSATPGDSLLGPNEAERGRAASLKL